MRAHATWPRRATPRACRWAAICPPCRQRRGAKAPTFLVAAMKDPLGGNLDRIQIVKGWLDKDGKGQEKVYDVVWGDASRRKVDRQGKLTPVGDTVDVAHRDLDQHHRRSGAERRLDGSRLRSVGAGLLLRARHRDSDAALDGVRRRPLRHHDAAGGPDEAPGARLGLAHLVHARAVARNFHPKFWMSADLRYFGGGETTTDGISDDNRIDETGGGISAGYALARFLSVQASYGRRFSTGEQKDLDMVRAKLGAGVLSRESPCRHARRRGERGWTYERLD